MLATTGFGGSAEKPGNEVTVPVLRTISLQVNEIGSGASQRERRAQLKEAARRREVD